MVNRDHPVMNGVSTWSREGKPYRNPNVAADIQLLISAEVNRETYPMAWARESNSRKVFYTSLGIPHDFEEESFIQLLDNALLWLAD